MRLLVFALVLLASLSTKAQTVGSCAAADIGSPSCPYQWIGATSVAFKGDGNGLGFVGMTSQCRADYGAGARMCTSAEILASDTLNLNAIPSAGCWVRPSFQTDASSNYLDGSGSIDNETMSCRGWSVKSIGRGLVLMPTGGLGPFADAGDGATGFTCDQSRPVACCKPIAVGEPQASMMLPAGIGVLAAFSALRAS